jgi:Domain of unknown function (DUF397)
MAAIESAELSWKKSSFCDPSECVEVASSEDHVLIRDSANRSGPVLDVHRDRWRTFINTIAPSPAGAGRFH